MVLLVVQRVTRRDQVGLLLGQCVTLGCQSITLVGQRSLLTSQRITLRNKLVLLVGQPIALRSKCIALRSQVLLDDCQLQLQGLESLDGLELGRQCGLRLRKLLLLGSNAISRLLQVRLGLSRIGLELEQAHMLHIARIAPGGVRENRLGVFFACLETHRLQIGRDRQSVSV